MPTPSYETHNAPYDPNSDTYRANDGSYSTSGRPYDPLAYYVRRYLTRALVFGAVFAAAFYFATRWSHGAPMESALSVKVTEPSASPALPTAVPELPTRAPVRSTDAPALPTAVAELPTESPALPTEAPELTTESPALPIEAPALPTEAPEQPTESPALPTIEVRALPVRPEHWESPAPARRLDDVHHLADTMAATELPASPLSELPDRLSRIGGTRIFPRSACRSVVRRETIPWPTSPSRRQQRRSRPLSGHMPAHRGTEAHGGGFIRSELVAQAHPLPRSPRLSPTAPLLSFRTADGAPGQRQAGRGMPSVSAALTPTRYVY